LIRGPGNKTNPSKRHESETFSASYRDDAERLDYVRQMLLELRQIANETGEGTLVYMIEMAMMEAEECRDLRQRASSMNR
jgi:hypothetical protein